MNWRQVAIAAATAILGLLAGQSTAPAPAPVEIHRELTDIKVTLGRIDERLMRLERKSDGVTNTLPKVQSQQNVLQ